MTAKRQRTRKQIFRVVLYVVLLGLLLLLVVKQRTNLEKALSQAVEADPAWLLAATIAMALSLPATALVYMSLSPKPLRFGRTVLVQTAGFCINKLLPSGSGAAGVSFLYLRANKVKGVLAGTIVVFNNLLGLVGHFILFWLLIALHPAVLQDIHFADLPSGKVLQLVACIGVALLGIAVLSRNRLRKLLQAFMSQTRPLLARPLKVIRALSFSMLITLCYSLTLYASAHAVGANIGMAAAIIALTASVLATSSIPSPGGIGVAEIGAYAGLVAVGVDPQPALAAALVYRVCSFWLPLAFGSIAFVVVTKRGYLRSRNAEMR